MDVPTTDDAVAATPAAPLTQPPLTELVHAEARRRLLRVLLELLARHPDETSRAAAALPAETESRTAVSPAAESSASVSQTAEAVDGAGTGAALPVVGSSHNEPRVELLVSMSIEGSLAGFDAPEYTHRLAATRRRALAIISEARPSPSGRRAPRRRAEPSRSAFHLRAAARTASRAPEHADRRADRRAVGPLISSRRSCTSSRSLGGGGDLLEEGESLA